MEGLSKREIFAAMAMQGILANPFANTASSVGEEAVKQADSLIAALLKKNSSAEPTLAEAHIRDALQRIYDIYGYAWPDPDQCMVRRALGMEDSN